MSLRRFVILLLLTSWPHVGCAAQRATDEQAPSPAPPIGVALYALSRGKGVPEPTRDALRRASRLLEDLRREGRVVRLEESRIGIEGETRVCAEFADAESARQALERIRSLAQGVELLNVVEEPCSKPSPPSGGSS
jgi:hypothetical protein